MEWDREIQRMVPPRAKPIKSYSLHVGFSMPSYASLTGGLSEAALGSAGSSSHGLLSSSQAI